MTAVIRIDSGPGAGATLRLAFGRRVTLGRSSQAGFRLEDPDVSRLHCSVENEGDCLVVTDLGSSNGTFVDGLSVRLARVEAGSVLRLGGVSLSVSFLQDAPSAVFVRGRADTPSAGTWYGTREALGSGQVDRAGVLEDPADLRSLLRLATALGSPQDHDAMARAAAEAARAGCGADRVALVLLSAAGGPPEYCTASAVAARSRELRIDSTVLGEVLAGRGCVAGEATGGEGPPARTLCAPLTGPEGRLGVVWAEADGPAHAPEDRLLAFLEAVGVLVGAAVHRARLQEGMKATFVGTIRSLVAALEVRDPYTRGHSERVTTAALAVGERLGLPPADQDVLEIAALLHDVGKVGMVEAVLHKHGALTGEEQAAMHRHAEAGGAIVRNIRHPRTRDVTAAVRHHHEHWDGTGYPDGLAGEAIPLAARIIAAADTWDAMTSDRPYRRALPAAQARAALAGASGTQLDPVCAAALAGWLDAGAPPPASRSAGSPRYVPTGLAPLPAVADPDGEATRVQ